MKAAIVPALNAPWEIREVRIAAAGASRHRCPTILTLGDIVMAIVRSCVTVLLVTAACALPAMAGKVERLYTCDNSPEMEGCREWLAAAEAAEAARLVACGVHPDREIPFDCTGRQNGNYRNPNDCCSYIACSNGNQYIMPCSTHLHWDWSVPDGPVGNEDNNGQCLRPEDAECSLKPAP